MVNPMRVEFPVFRVKLADYVGEGWGHEEGREAFAKINRLLTGRSEPIVLLDARGVKRMDVTFARESVANLVRQHRVGRALFIGDASESVRENIDAALARAKLSVLHRSARGDYQVLGLELRGHLRATLEIVDRLAPTTAKVVAAQVEGGMNLPACNNRLKDLADAGLVLRVEDSAESGGKEYVYVALNM
jgi:hypothetical protein